MIPQDLITKYLGTNPITYMATGMITLILINLILSVWLAAKSKQFDFKIVPDFIQPTLMYLIFLITMEVLVISTSKVPMMSTMFTGVQYVALAGVLGKYVSQIYTKLKELGMQTSHGMDNQIQNITDDVPAVVNVVTPSVTPDPNYVPAGGIVVDQQPQDMPKPLEQRPEEDNR